MTFLVGKGGGCGFIIHECHQSLDIVESIIFTLPIFVRELLWRQGGKDVAGNKVLLYLGDRYFNIVAGGRGVSWGIEAERRNNVLETWVRNANRKEGARDVHVGRGRNIWRVPTAGERDAIDKHRQCTCVDCPWRGWCRTKRGVLTVYSQHEWVAC